MHRCIEESDCYWLESLKRWDAFKGQRKSLCQVFRYRSWNKEWIVSWIVFITNLKWVGSKRPCLSELRQNLRTPIFFCFCISSELSTFSWNSQKITWNLNFSNYLKAEASPLRLSFIWHSWMKRIRKLLMMIGQSIISVVIMAWLLVWGMF